MKYFLVGTLLIGFFFKNLDAQFTRYVIKLKDKNGSPYAFSNPIAYLSQSAIDRRNRYGISIDSTDLPVTPSYITQIENVPNVTVLNISKWLNAVTVQTSDANAVSTINGFSFVQSASGIAARMSEPGKMNSKFESHFAVIDNSVAKANRVYGAYYNYGASSFNEIHLHNGEFLHNIGLRGQGMQIAMLDNGFNNYTSSSLHAFDSVNANNQVLGTWDFVAREPNVSDDGNHGMSCFSIIAANIPGQFIGKAPQANFWLYQTEDNSSEQLIEEFNWACGAERADSSGADIISSSLGYTTFDSVIVNSVKIVNPNDHSYADMNGNTTMAAIAADLAAKKGILVFIANGNSGNSAWHYLNTPADGDNVIGVGAVDINAAVANFSSYGPSSDGQIKPDLASIGVSAILQTSGGTIGFGNGTSFACPNMAGLATCLWQGFPEFNNMKIRTALWLAGDKVSNPSTHAGYGIPNLKIAFATLLKDFSTAQGSIENCQTTVSWTSKDVSAMKYEIERKTPHDTGYTKIAEVSSVKNVSVLSNHTYKLVDSIADMTTGGTFSYRIKQILDTSTANFTAIYIDTVNTSCNTVTLKIVPNPVTTNQVTLKIESDFAVQKLNILFIDMLGQTVLQSSSSKTEGTTSFNFPIQHLPEGIYIVVIYDGQKRLVSKQFIKL